MNVKLTNADNISRSVLSYSGSKPANQSETFVYEMKYAAMSYDENAN